MQGVAVAVAVTSRELLELVERLQPALLLGEAVGARQSDLGQVAVRALQAREQIVGLPGASFLTQQTGQVEADPGALRRQGQCFPQLVDGGATIAPGDILLRPLTQRRGPGRSDGRLDLLGRAGHQFLGFGHPAGLAQQLGQHALRLDVIRTAREDAAEFGFGGVELVHPQQRIGIGQVQVGCQAVGRLIEGAPVGVQRS